VYVILLLLYTFTSIGIVIFFFYLIHPSNPYYHLPIPSILSILSIPVVLLLFFYSLLYLEWMAVIARMERIDRSKDEAFAVFRVYSFIQLS